MDKKAALLTLIKHSQFLTDNVKMQIIANIDKMSDEDVHCLGRFLALETKLSIEKGGQMITDTEEIEKNLQSE